MEVPRLGGKSELQLEAYTTATATRDPSCICNLHHSSWQCQILNPLMEARDRTRNLMVPSRIPFCCATVGTPGFLSTSRQTSLHRDCTHRHGGSEWLSEVVSFKHIQWLQSKQSKAERSGFSLLPWPHGRPGLLAASLLCGRTRGRLAVLEQSGALEWAAGAGA